jgi:para-aminobenzoate synthetase component 1
LFRGILDNNPAPWASYLEIPELNIASASPELFLQRSGSRVKTSPIKGTQLLGSSEFGTKDQSENIMIVDLMRNDLGMICESGTVEVSRLLYSQDHPGLQHLVSDVEGDLVSGISWRSILESISPPGSVSGAPKSSAVSVIAEHEKPRGPYCGILGWVQGDQAQLSVAIRIFWKDKKINFGTGAGITFSSQSQAEWEETELKASRLIKIAAGQI